MDEIIPGVCYPVFVYLVFSLLGVLGILLQGGRNSGLMSFVVFVIMCFSTLLTNMLCIHSWISTAWASCMITLIITLFVVNDPNFGNVNIMGYVASVVGQIVDNFRKIYRAFKYITAK